MGAPEGDNYADQIYPENTHWQDFFNQPSYRYLHIEGFW